MASIKDSFLNDGQVSPRTKGETVYNDSGGTLSPGDLVYFSGWYQPSSTTDRPCRKVKKADANGGLNTPAQAVVRSTLTNGNQGRVFKTYRLTDINTSAASAVGDPVYLSNTAGSYTLTAPTASDSRVQLVGRVAVIHATTGAIEFNTDEAPAPGSAAPSVLTDLPVRTEGGALSVGDLVYVSGWSETHLRHLVTKADSDAATPAKRATYIIGTAISNNANGVASRSLRLTGLNTNAGNVSDPVYLSATAGGWTLTPPTAAANRVQIVGRIAVKSGTVGEIEFNLTANDAFSQLGNGDLLAGILSADAAGRALFAAGVLDVTTFQSAVAAGILSADATGRAFIASNFFDAATVDAKIATDAIGEDRLTPGELYGRVVANTTIGASVTPGGASRAITAPEVGIPVMIELNVADAASGNADFTGLPYKIRVVGVDYLKTTGAGNAGNSATLHNGTTGNAITGAMNGAADKDVDNARSLDDAFIDVAANTTLRVVTVRAGGDNSCKLTIRAIRLS